MSGHISPPRISTASSRSKGSGRSSQQAKASHWRKVLAEQVASGVTIREFCQERQINRSTFQYWCDKFFRADQIPTDQNSRGNQPASRQPLKVSGGGFIPVATSKVMPSRFSTPRILLPNGVSIELNRSFDDPGVSAFLKALCGVNQDQSQKQQEGGRHAES